MAKFRKKPAVVEAVQWWPGQVVDGVVPLPEHVIERLAVVPRDAEGREALAFVDTLEGGHVVSPGDWIITGIKGERYPCKPDIFAATYEPAHEEPVQFGGCGHVPRPGWCAGCSVALSSATVLRPGGKATR